MNKNSLVKIIKKDLEEYMESGNESIMCKAQQNHSSYLAQGGRKEFQTIKNSVMREVAYSKTW